MNFKETIYYWGMYVVFYIGLYIIVGLIYQKQDIPEPYGFKLIIGIISFIFWVNFQYQYLDYLKYKEIEIEFRKQYPLRKEKFDLTKTQYYIIYVILFILLIIGIYVRI